MPQDVCLADSQSLRFVFVQMFRGGHWLGAAVWAVAFDGRTDVGTRKRVEPFHSLPLLGNVTGMQYVRHRKVFRVAKATDKQRQNQNRTKELLHTARICKTAKRRKSNFIEPPPPMLCRPLREPAAALRQTVHTALLRQPPCVRRRRKALPTHCNQPHIGCEN